MLTRLKYMIASARRALIAPELRFWQEEVAKLEARRQCDITAIADLHAQIKVLKEDAQEKLAQIEELERQRDILRGLKLPENNQTTAPQNAVVEQLNGQIDRLKTQLRAQQAAYQGLHDETCVGVTVGGGLRVYGTSEAISRVQTYILLDSKHPVEASDVRRKLAADLQAADGKIHTLEKQMAALIRSHEENLQREKDRSASAALAFERKIAELQARLSRGSLPRDAKGHFIKKAKS